MSQARPGHDGSPDGVDLTAYPTAKKLAERSLEFLQEIKNLYNPLAHLESTATVLMILQHSWQSS